MGDLIWVGNELYPRWMVIAGPLVMLAVVFGLAWAVATIAAWCSK